MNNFNYKVFLFLLLLIGVLGAIFPIAYILIIIPTIGIIFSIFSIIEICRYLWILIIITAFFGAYASIPGYENYYLFRLLLPIHAFFFLFSNQLKSNFFKKYTIYLVFLSGWLGSGLLSLYIAKDINLGFRYCYYMCEIIYLFFLCIFYIREKKSYKEVASIILIIYHIAVIIGILEVITGWHMRLSSANVYITTHIAHQPTGFLYNPNDYALLLCILFPIVISFIEDSGKGLWRWLWQLGIVVITIYLVISTYSRIGMICLLVNLIFIMSFQFNKKTLITVMLQIPFVCIYFTSTSSGLILLQKVYASFMDKSTSTNARENLYITLWKIIKESNFIGVGAGNTPIQLNKYLLGYSEVLGDGYTTGHNFWLESAGNIGAIGFIIIITLMIVYFYQAIRFPLVMGKKSFVILTPLLIGISFIGSSIALSTILEKRFLWFTLWIGICLICIKLEEGEE